MPENERIRQQLGLTDMNYTGTNPIAPMAAILVGGIILLALIGWAIAKKRASR